MKKVVSRLFIALLCLQTLFAQKTKSDSLMLILQQKKEDTSKVNVLNDLAFELRSSDPQKSIDYCNQAIALSSKLDFRKGLGVAKINMAVSQINTGEYGAARKNAQEGLVIAEKLADKFNIGRAYNSIGEAFRYEDNYPEALKNYNIALAVRKEMDDKKGIASVLNNIGIVNFNLGNYPEALNKHFEALKIREHIGDQQAVAASYNNIALVYLKQLNFADALKNHYSALGIRKQLNDKRGMAASYTNIGNLLRLQNKTQEALKNYLLAQELFLELGDKKNIAGSNNNIGSSYQIEADSLLAQNDKANALIKVNEAIRYFLIASPQYEEIKSSSGAILIAENLGNANKTLGNYQKARGYYESGLKISIKIGSKEDIKNFYSDLTKIDALLGNYKSAFENHQLYITYRDSLDNEETRKKTIQTQMTYEFEKKEAVADAEHKKELENQQALADEKARKQKVVLLFVLGGFLLVLVFAVLIFRSLRVTRKQKSIIELQKTEVEKQKHLVEEKQKEIIDSITYARRIQRSLLPTEKYIAGSIKRLHKKTE